jgi:hypothetical protein
LNKYIENKPKNTLGPRIVSLLYWLEECSQLYVQLILNPAGIGFPDDQVPETVINYVQRSVLIKNLEPILIEHTEDNIWRSWELFSDELCQNPVSYVPILIDIDNREQNLKHAHCLTLICLDLFEKKTQFQNQDSLRIVFSGRKGFHIEAKPVEPYDNQTIREDILSELAEVGIRRGAKNVFLYGTIDPVAEFIRLTGSYNSWIENGVVISRKVIQYTPDEFRKLRIDDIIARSEAT